MKSTQLLIAALFLSFVLPVVAQDKPKYEIYALRYATIPDCPVSG